MIRHQELIFALTGQSFFFDVPEGRPDASPAPTVSVYLTTNSDIAGTEVATTGSAAIEAIDTTLTTDAAAATNQLLLTSAAGVARGRRYLLTAADGSTETHEIIGLNGTTATTRRPLTNTFTAAGSKFQSTRISIGVNATWINDQSRISDILGVTWRTDREPRTEWKAGYVGYRVRWSYSVGGVAAISATFADVVRYNAKNLVNPLDVDQRFPGWIDRLPTDYQHDQGASLLLDAFYQFKMDLIGDDQAIRRVRNTELVAELVVHKANLMIAENAVLAGRPSTDAHKLAEEIYGRRYKQLFREPKVQVDQTSGGEAAQARRLPAWRR